HKIAQLRLIAVKARNHGLEHFLRIEFVKIEWIPGLRRQHIEECQLRTAIALPEGMDRVELAQKVRSVLGKVFRSQVLKEICNLQLAEQLVGLTLDILGKAERIATLCDANSTRFASPLVDILEQVMMDRAIMGEIKVAGR